MDRNTVTDNVIKNVANTLLYLSELRDAATGEGDRDFIASFSAPLVEALEKLEKLGRSTAAPA
ncbi:hypothetical protein ACGFZB_28490 [Streptomyces cinerochromogenes]|uniref:Uncharacterized protein n=1 Tax=Streptomyces cinerochromogenes TaxID=66422 RepID=A0ABW7BAS0_9ACTN